jgi:hypothetical protein
VPITDGIHRVSIISGDWGDRSPNIVGLMVDHREQGLFPEWPRASGRRFRRQTQIENDGSVSLIDASTSNENA